MFLLCEHSCSGKDLVERNYDFLHFVWLQAMAADDGELLQWFTDSSSTRDKENLAPPTVSVARQQGQSSVMMDESSQDSIPDDVSLCDGEWR